MAPIAVFLSYYRPWAAIAVAVAVYYKIIVDQNYSVKNAPFYLGKYLLGFLSIWGVYTVFLYPAFFSPLRHLPQPKVCDE
jgi:succinate-acetate transporter protein